MNLQTKRQSEQRQYTETIKQLQARQSEGKGDTYSLTHIYFLYNSILNVRSKCRSAEMFGEATHVLLPTSEKGCVVWMVADNHTKVMCWQCFLLL